MKKKGDDVGSILSVAPFVVFSFCELNNVLISSGGTISFCVKTDSYDIVTVALPSF